MVFRNKRGMHYVLVIALLILVFIAIIWVIIYFYNNLSANRADYMEVSLLNDEIQVLPESIALNNQNVSFVVERVSGFGEIVGLQVFLEDGSGNVKEVDVRQSLQIGEQKNISVYYADELRNVAYLTIAPIKINSQGEEFADIIS
jgi:hypothetical protein